jgi:hypothetical protein
MVGRYSGSDKSYRETKGERVPLERPQPTRRNGVTSLPQKTSVQYPRNVAKVIRTHALAVLHSTWCICVETLRVLT